ncbi:hypothetical protein IWZ03DRAFT_366844 [Phyllosticta citriasiana]|uniref:Uncharacterized protein n=1 Tax=Phyllosticta citriasiana TaxID=595635 RepID=A0ABR1KZM6_9PEZI
MAFSASPTKFFLSFCPSFVLLSSITSVKTKHKLPGISNFGCLSPTNFHLSFGADLWLLVAGSGLLGQALWNENRSQFCRGGPRPQDYLGSSNLPAHIVNQDSASRILRQL